MNGVPMFKNKRVRLHGKALSKLNTDIHSRDGDCCILCGEYVDPGEKFHHEPVGADKQDRIEFGVTLCGKCHYERHFGKRLQLFRQKIEDYLRNRYPDVW